MFTPEAVLLLLFVFAFGAVMGSFGNVLIYRVPEGKSIGGRSHCPWCHKQLGMLDLVPILSYLFLRGKCRYCKKTISPQYPAVEFASGILFALSFWLFQFTFVPAILLGLSLWLLLLIAIVDARHAVIPDAFNLPLLVCTIGFAFVMGSFTRTNFFWAPVIGAGFFGLQWLISRGKWVGSGDILLGASMGFLLRSVSHLVVALFFAYIIGAIIASAMLSQKSKAMNDHLPFAPFLAAGTFFALFFGNIVLSITLGS